MNLSNNDRILTTKEVWQITRMSRETIRRLRLQNKFPQPHSDVGKKHLWLLSEIEEWIRNRATNV